MEKIINVIAKIENGPEAQMQMDEFLESIDCSMKAQMQIDIAFDELFSNVAYYAYGGAEGPCTIRLVTTDDKPGVKISYIDEGTPYNPLQHEDPDTSLSIDDRGVGGLGILMVKKSMDALDYEYTDGKNILTLTKYF